jgi:hypothetical protein
MLFGAWPVGAFELGLPIECELGKSCWIVNYVDLDAGKEVRDPSCLHRSYDGHDGTDFALPSLTAMQRGVSVLAAAPGTVTATRDGVDDVSVNKVGRQAVEGRECGNGVVIDHDDGWQTQYCHMRKGSIAVKQQQRVEAGTRLGRVGLSGRTEFPHLHFTVRRHRSAFDPFTGASIGEECGKGPGTLWREDIRDKIAYQPVLLAAAGIAGAEPSYSTQQDGRAQRAATAASPVLALWVDLFGVEAGDIVRFVLKGPDGKAILESESRIDRRRARSFLYAGKRKGAERWPAGTYRGEVTFERKDGGVALSRTVEAELR